MVERFLLDTDIVIYWLKGVFPKIDQKIKTLGVERTSISMISVAELYFGAHNSSKIEENTEVIDDLVQKLGVVSLDERSCRFFGQKKSELKRSGRILPDSDLFIASIAVANDLVLVTNNERHFSRIEELELENWI